MAAHPTPDSDESRSIWSVLNIILAALVGGFALFWGAALLIGAVRSSAGFPAKPDAPAAQPATPAASAVAEQQAPAAPNQPPATAAQAPATATPATPAAPAGGSGSVAEITIKVDLNNPLAYDTKEIRVTAGQKVKLTFNNVHPSVPQPHNLVIGKPGSKDTLMAAAMQMAAAPDGMAKGFIPDTPDILFHTKLLQPNTSEVLEFTAPAVGEYPYLCTFPGHAILMNGVMKVEPAPSVSATPAPTPAAAQAPATATPAAPAGGSGSVAEITIKVDLNNPLAYDIKEIRVKAGQKVKLTFNNVHPSVPQPHNLVIGKPGSKDTLMAAAMQMAAAPDGMAKGFIPDTPNVLFHTKLLQPNMSEVLEFTAPAAGEYPYLCTFPGHAILMNGVMKVE